MIPRSVSVRITDRSPAYPVETWILISIGKTTTRLVIKILFDQVSFQPQLWHAHTNNTDQSFSYQIDPFHKESTDDRKPDQRFLVTGRDAFLDGVQQRLEEERNVLCLEFTDSTQQNIPQKNTNPSHTNCSSSSEFDVRCLVTPPLASKNAAKFCQYYFAS